MLSLGLADYCIMVNFEEVPDCNKARVDGLWKPYMARS